jgi:GST-like protein
MIDLYYYPTPNGWKVTIMLEECGLPYRIMPVDIRNGEQFRPGFLAVNPNNKIPAIVDRDGHEGPQTVFESGAILIYLAEKTGKFMPMEARPRVECLEWLFWQVAGLGPMLGQANYFRNSSPEKIPSAIERYVTESERLLGVMNMRLETREYLAGGAYSIADIACFGWINRAAQIGIPLDPFPHVQQWHANIAGRDAVKAGMAVGV